jgi:uncharacterized membrane protein
MKDTTKRTVTKTMTWRVLGTASTFFVSYLVTGSWSVSSGIAIIQMVVNTVLYLAHEKVWNAVRWGKK